MRDCGGIGRTRTKYTMIGRGEDAEAGVVSNRRPTVRTGVFAWVGRSGKAWVEWVYVLVGDSHRGFDLCYGADAAIRSPKTLRLNRSMLVPCYTLSKLTLPITSNERASG